MKSWKKLVILVAALAVCVGACFLVIDLAKDDEGEDPTEAASYICSFDKDITSVTYTFEGAEETLQSVNYSWVLASDADMPLRQSDLDTLAASLKTGFESVRLVDDSGSLVKSADFGLDAPKLIMKISDGTVAKTICIGAFNSAYEAYYANIEGENNVYLVEPDIPDAFSKDVYALALDAAEFPEFTTEDIRSIKLQKDAAERLFTYAEGGSPLLYTDSYTWFETEADGTYSALRTTAMTTLCGALCDFADVTGIAYNPSEADLAAFGLDKDLRVADITYMGEKDVENDVGVETVEAELELKITFSQPDAEGICYMMWSDNTVVYRVTAEKADAVMKFISEDLIPDEVCLIPMTSVESFTVNYNDAKVVIVKNEKTITDDDGNKTTTEVFTANENVADSNTVNSFYNALLGLTVESRAEQGTWQENETPYMTVEFNRNTENFKNMTLYVYKYNVNFYRISFNGNDDILVSIRTIDNMGEEILKTLKLG